MLYLKTSNTTYPLTGYMDSTIQYEGEHNMEACMQLDPTIDFDSLVTEVGNQTQIQIVDDNSNVIATYQKNESFEVERLYHPDEERLEIRVRHMYTL